MDIDGAADLPSAYFGGRFHAAEGADFDVISPVDEHLIGRVNEVTVDEIDQAVISARGAADSWARTPAPERGDALRRIAAALEAEEQALAQTLSAELGKPRHKASDDVRNAAGYLRYMAEWDRRIEGEIVPADSAGEAIHLTRVPLGVVGAITAWNYPIDLLVRKLAPALVTGNTIVVKPTELAPFTALAMAKAIDQRAALPAGVFNLVSGGKTVGARLIAHPGIDMITMTGHRDTGKKVMAAAAQNLTRVSLELGGSAPALVFPDADLDCAVKAILFARFENSGQVCTCAERIILHRSIHRAFLDRFVAAAERIVIGHPVDNPDMGPLVSKAQRDKVMQAIAMAEASGARRHLGSLLDSSRFERGWWCPPTILDGMPRNGPLSGEEIFGPVAAIYVADDEDEMVAIANETRYGLSAFIFTESYRRVMRLSERIDCGELYVNRTMGEAMQGFHSGHRESGMGGEDGRHGVLKYTQIRTIYHRYA